MADIEDFVVEAVIGDMQNQLAQVPQGLPPPMVNPVSQSLPITTAVANAPKGAATAGAQPQHRFRVHGVDFTPEQFDAYLQSPLPGQQDLPLAQRMTVGKQAQKDYAKQQQEQVNALNKRDAARATIMQGIRGLDPQVQGMIMKRLGIDVGPMKSQLEQQKELATFKAGLEGPQNEVQNAIKMLLAQRQVQQGQQELDLNKRKVEADIAGRAESRDLQVMKVLAMMAQNNPQLQAAIGPLLLQMFQGMGINLTAPGQSPQPTRGSRTYSPRKGVTITEE